MESTSPPLPTFLVIGAQKSATRWLRHNLGKHPDVFTVEHEIAFFNRRSYREHGIDWYREQFAAWSGERFLGEATPGYMMFTQSPNRVARRIHEHLPDVRLIAILRDPVDRANSAMVHHMKRGRIPPDAQLLELVQAQPPEEDGFGLITGGWYATSLRLYQQLFGEQLLILLHDEVVDDPRQAYARALRHIGAAPDYAPSDLDQVVFSNQQRKASRWRREVSFRDRLVLFEYFRKDVSRLRRLFGLDVDHWDPARIFRGQMPNWPFVFPEEANSDPADSTATGGMTG